MILRLAFIFLMCVLIRSIKTVQNISQNLGHKWLSALLIAVDTVLFLLVFKNVIDNELTILIVIAVALGYVIGYLIGSFLEDKIALGKAVVTIKISKERARSLAALLKENGFVFIQSKRHYSHKGKYKKIFQCVLFRKELPKLKKVVKGLPIIATVEHVKDTFGRELLTAEQYLKNEMSKE